MKKNCNIIQELTSFMKHLCLLAFGVLFTWALSAQDLHIYYNSQTESLRYEIDGQPISRPKVRKGSSVFLHIENFNNYIYNANVTTDNRDITTPPASAGSIASLVSGLGGNANNLLAALEGSGGRGLAGNLNFANDKGSNDRGVVSYDASFGLSRAAFTELAEAMTQFEQAFTKLRALDTALQVQKKEIKNILEAHQIRAIVMQEVDAVKYDPSLTPDQIKKLAKDYLEKVLDAKAPTDINLNTLLERGDTRGKLSRELEQVKMQHALCNQQIAALSQIKESVALYNAPERPPGLRALTLPIIQAYDQVETFDANYKQLEQDIDATLREMPETDLLKLTAMWRTYEGLSTNTFSRTYRTIAKGDQLSFSIKLDPTEAARLKLTSNSVQLAPIEVPVYGGFKVNASIGVAFGQPIDRPQSFFVRDSIIRGEDKDSFVPIISSFFHFYGQTANTVSFGGSFGIGLPIGGSSNLQSASFFLGPSMIIGRGERIVLTGGLMGTRVERLAQGFQVGDRFRSVINNVPTKQVYELGYFLGLSFNVLGGR
jgi:hypothetical protein